MTAPAPELAAFLHEHGLAPVGDDGEWTSLAGGVSSDIWCVETGLGAFCVKRALAQLKVAASWNAPVSRNASEWHYLRFVQRIVPGGVPLPIAHDEDRGLFAMEWLSPADYRLWKTELIEDRASIEAAAAVGALLGTIHHATADDPVVAERFATDDTFRALRIEPYLLATAAHHPDLAATIEEIAVTTATTRRVLVHGDVSPKNILLGQSAPVLLDAECAWFGDPAFDLAFCINHLVLKAHRRTPARDRLIAAAEALAQVYLAHVDWEEPTALERRAARLLPALALARIDGKSPVEYLGEDDRDKMRDAARLALLSPADTLATARGQLLA